MAATCTSHCESAHSFSSLRARQQALSVQLQVVPEDPVTGLTDTAILESHLRRLRHAPLLLGSFSAGSNVTGIAADTRALSAMMHRYGGISAFDYASAAASGCVAMATGVADAQAHHDVVMLSPHKFAGGPGSCGVLVIKRDVIRESMPHICGAQFCLLGGLGWFQACAEGCTAS